MGVFGWCEEKEERGSWMERDPSVVVVGGGEESFAELLQEPLHSYPLVRRVLID